MSRRTITLIGAPYRSTDFRPGDRVKCRVRGWVTVDGITRGPIRWPYVQQLGGKRSLILCGELERAVRTESVQAVMHYWGVSRTAVRRWRRTIGVGRFTEGTRQLWIQLAPLRLSPEARRRGGLARAAQ
jgi:hypothetical protein